MVHEILRAGAGEVIFEEGTLGDLMYIVRSGRVEVSRGDTVLAVLGKGSMFGEHGLLRRLPRTATIRAVEDAELESLDHEALLERMTADPVFALRLLSHLSDMTHRLAEEFMSRAADEELESVRNRLAEIEFEGPVEAN
jgi:CRP-like cAMP-binding protein